MKQPKSIRFRVKVSRVFTLLNGQTTNEYFITQPLWLNAYVRIPYQIYLDIKEDLRAGLYTVACKEANNFLRTLHPNGNWGSLGIAKEIVDKINIKHKLHTPKLPSLNNSTTENKPKLIILNTYWSKNDTN